MSTLRFTEFYDLLLPLAEAIYPFVIVFAIFPLSFWLKSKIVLIKEGKENLKNVVIKLLILIFFLFNWHSFFKAAFLLNDALEQRVLDIDISKSLPNIVPNGEILYMDNVVDLMYGDYKMVNIVLDSHYQKTAQDIEQLEEESHRSPFMKKFVNSFKIMARQVEGIGTTAVSGLAQGLRALHIETQIKNLLAWVASIAKDCVYIARLFFGCLFYCIVPALIFISYIPILGDTEDSKGLNSFSKKTISLFLNIAMWPTIYALADKLLLILYYVLLNNGNMDNISTHTAFFILYVVVYITLPFTIQKANPYGLVQGMISGISTLATVAAISAAPAAKAAGGLGSAAIGSASKIAGGATGAASRAISSIKSNSDNMGGS